MQRAGIKDILSGLIFVGFGAAFGYAATGYPIGTAFRMGPGYFPLVLAGALGLLGVAIVVKGVTAAAADTPIGPVPWRGAVLVLGGARLLRRHRPRPRPGPALFVTAFLSALASRSNPPLAALAIAAALTLACVLIFHYGLGVPVPLFGSWLGG